jgi:hypothetical protein
MEEKGCNIKQMGLIVPSKRVAELCFCPSTKVTHNAIASQTRIGKAGPPHFSIGWGCVCYKLEGSTPQSLQDMKPGDHCAFRVH